MVDQMNLRDQLTRELDEIQGDSEETSSEDTEGEESGEEPQVLKGKAPHPLGLPLP